MSRAAARTGHRSGRRNRVARHSIAEAKPAPVASMATEDVPPLQEAAAELPRPRRVSAVMQVPDFDPAEGDIETTGQGGMRIYSAILGRDPAVDPDAPDVVRTDPLPEPHSPERTWKQAVRDEVGKALHVPRDTPTWRQILEHLTTSASQRLSDARKRIGDRPTDGRGDRAA